MAITSLIVKIGAKDEEIQKALDRLGKQAGTVDAELQRLGATPLGREALKSLDQIGVAMKAVTDAQQKLADRAVAAARGLDLIGGASKLTSDELTQVNRTVERGIDAFRALGKDVPPGLQRIADETKKVEQAHGSLGSTLKNVALGFAALFTARAALNFVGDVLEEASALKDLSQQTHINVEELQLLAGAMSEFGVDADTLGKGLFALSRKVAGGDDSVAKALAVMGLSLKDVQGLNGEALFLEIEHGLSKLQGSLRDETAATLFGSRLGMAMAGASEGIDGALDTARRFNTVLTSESIDAMDSYQESIQRAQRSLSAMAGNAIGPVAEGFNVLNDAAAKGASKWQIFVAMFKDFTNSGLRVGASTSALTKLLDDLNKKTEAARASTAAFVGPIQQLASAHAIAAPKATSHAKATDDFKTAADKAAAAAMKFAESARGLSFKTFIEDTSKLNAVIPDLSGHLADQAAIFADVRAHMDDLESSGIALNRVETATGAIIGGTIIPAFSTLPNVVAQGTKAIGDATAAVATLGDTLRGSLSSALGNIPTILIKSFQGGGGLIGAFKAIGVQLGDAITQPIIERLGKLQKAAVSTGASLAAALGGATAGSTGAAVAGIAGSLGGAALAASHFGVAMTAAGAAGAVALGAATLGIGAAAVGLVLLIKHWGAEEKQVNKVRQAFVDASGGLDVLNAHAQAAGVTLDRMLRAKNAADFNAAMVELTTALAIFDAKAQAATSSVGALLGIVQTTGGVIPEALKPAIQKLIDLGLVTGNTADLFKTLAGNTEVDFKTLSAIASKYGADLTKLGPAFQAARLHDLSVGIVNDFATLERGLGDTDEALRVMVKPINDLVNESLKAGIAIPENFKPWIEQLAKTGQLTDANGDKITDLSQLKFAPPIVSEFDKIVTKLQELIDKISGGLTNSLNNIPHPPAPWDGWEPPPSLPDYGRGGYAAHGGLITETGVQRFAVGGRVLPFLARGRDTVPAMLTPGEIVLNTSQQAAVGSAMGAGSAALAAVARLQQDLPQMIARANRDAIQKVSRR